MSRRPVMWWTTVKGGRRAARRPWKWMGRRELRDESKRPVEPLSGPPWWTETHPERWADSPQGGVEAGYDKP